MSTRNTRKNTKLKSANEVDKDDIAMTNVNRNKEVMDNRHRLGRLISDSRKVVKKNTSDEIKTKKTLAERKRNRSRSKSLGDGKVPSASSSSAKRSKRADKQICDENLEEQEQLD